MNTDPGTSLQLEVTVNHDLARRVRGDQVAAQLGGSIYAVPPRQRQAASAMLMQRDLWVHADVFAEPGLGVSLDLISDLADQGTGPVDVHLLTAETLDALKVVCRPGIARVTFPFENVPDPEAVAARIRRSGAAPWLAVAPETSLGACADVLPPVDGVLVMLLPPGTSGRSDLTLLTKVTRASTDRPVGVDGGVSESNVDQILAAGATYVVIGRRLMSVTPHAVAEEGP